MLGKGSVAVVAAAVRRLRKQRGWSQEQLGHRADLHRTYIGAIERCEENMTLRTLDKLAAALGVPPIDLMKSADADRSIIGTGRASPRKSSRG